MTFTNNEDWTVPESAEPDLVYSRVVNRSSKRLDERSFRFNPVLPADVGEFLGEALF